MNTHVSLLVLFASATVLTAACDADYQVSDESPDEERAAFLRDDDPSRLSAAIGCEAHGQGTYICEALVDPIQAYTYGWSAPAGGLQIGAPWQFKMS